MKLRRKRVAALVMAAGLGILSVAGGSMTVFADTYAAGTTVISSGQEFASYASSGSMYGNYVLACDIDLSASPVGGVQLEGTLDGNGHTIYGAGSGGQSVFQNIGSQGALKNVTFDGTLNVNATQYLDIGGISKNNAGTIENCVSRVNINVDGAKVRVGGIVSQNVGTVKNCTNEGDIYGTISEAGGIIGSNGGALVSDCVNKGNITIKNADEYAYRVGGIIADDGDYDLPQSAVSVINCKNSGDLKTTQAGTGCTYMGGIIGVAMQRGTQTTVSYTNCENTGNLSARGNVGGIISYIEYGMRKNNATVPTPANLVMDGCWNSGTIMGMEQETSAPYNTAINLGGLFGSTSVSCTGTIYIKNSGNTGSLYLAGNTVQEYDTIGGIGGRIATMSDNGTTPYFYVENCKNKGYVDTRASFASEQIGASQGDNIAVTGCDYSGDHYKTDADGTIHAYRADGSKIINQFVFDGRYTYYFQADGTAMRDRLTYHPDGEHIIYLDTKGHEVFTNFQYCPSVGYTCYFDSQGYLYKDQITFVGNNVYYLNANGAMEQNGWFRFANGRDYGYGNSDGTIKADGWGYDPYGRVVFYHWNGMVARGLISDGAYYYSMDNTDGHYLGQFPVSQ